MPLGFERLNERSQRPNALINFIKPLKLSSPENQKTAQDFLERIAAQCYPVMKRDHISVMSLEEYPPNREFLGRNFNAGEVIQLVLKDKAGQWLSFRFVQMVMMHELAHCKQMNHSKFFWQVRNRYADHMKELWAQKYHGEGIWGRGQDLTSGSFVHDRMPDSPDIPEHLCGGTYRRARGRKRKRGNNDAGNQKLTYAERQQKRIARKFGVHGEGHDLGEDEWIRGALEQGNRRPGKPKVANSKRGRELRASAALARLEGEKQARDRQQMQENKPTIDDDSDETDDSEADDLSDDGVSSLDGLTQIKDQRGRALYQVCGDEGEQQEGGKNELDELRLLGADEEETQSGTMKASNSQAQVKTSDQKPNADSETESDEEFTASITRQKKPTDRTAHSTEPPIPSTAIRDARKEIDPPRSDAPDMDATSRTIPKASTCPICTMENENDRPTCLACSHVLKPALIPHHWRCKSNDCRGTSYINAGDVGRCGLCGGLKPALEEKKPMGVLSADVLRWD